jgi:hypothetical protein
MSGETSGSVQANTCHRCGKSAAKWGQGMFEVLDHGVRLAFIDERPVPGDRAEPILLIHGFASTHAVNWVFPQ